MEGNFECFALFVPDHDCLSPPLNSLTHVCKELNQEIQADFIFLNIRKPKYCVLHILDAGTAYSETYIVSKRSGDIMAGAMEINWILKHGASLRFSADG